MEGACETVYVSNLNDRVSAADLQSLLYELFAGYGEVIAVQVLKGKKSKTGKHIIRGTAFVSLKSVAQAAIAVRNLKNFNFLGKDIKVQFAHKRSDEILKLHGTFKPKFKPNRILVEE
jgi:RNA recognition motif-containing protein